MGLVYGGKSTVRDSLILELDAANQKSWGGGNTWKDTTSQGNDLSLLNGLTHSQGPFPGAGYVDFDGNGDAINITHNNTLAGDFTVECWVRLNTNGIMMVGSSGYDYNTQWMRFNQNSTGNISSYMDGSGYFFQNVAGGITTNKWHHVSICRSGTNTRLFVDGDLKATNTSWTGSPRFDKIGALYNNGSIYTNDPNYFNGSISNVRVLDGTALYTSNFTPPKGPLENISNTTLLTCQGNSITDASDNSSSITPVGNAAAVYNSQSYFHFDGTDDYLRDDTILDTFTATTDPWSVECWFNTDVNPSDIECMIAINYNNGVENTLLLGVHDVSGCKLNVYYRNAEISSNTTVTVGQWHHVVATHTSGSLKVYLDGTQIASNSNTVNQSLDGCAFLIGAELDSGNSLGNYFDGKISNVRMYSKTLSAAEVTQNFNALKGRYGI